MTGVAVQLDELCDVVGEIDALAALALESFDRADWRGADPQLVERTAYIIGIIARTAAIASSKLDGFYAAVADTVPVPAGEGWDGEGTAQGEASDRDAEIVRRLRERCPDDRFGDRSTLS